jgi:hypothetical protein
MIFPFSSVVLYQTCILQWHMIFPFSYVVLYQTCILQLHMIENGNIMYHCNIQVWYRTT